MAMTKTDFFKEIAEIMEIDPSGLTGKEALREIGNWDSLAVISFIALADEHFDVIVPGEKIKGAVSLDDLAGLVGL